ncbi:MAG: tRNA (adenosine(37)-N6)-threonylcarbamoyltransferase complex ATPase subunit type 1 TsaE [Clostridiales bacterium]|jgi:tRNA threonylcarbamoyladenosine biosynthesis protein TsaE|nr:tRNA (adenosine(37)-N6)-threonylcarbamoyltransferase complex ATPase subunit type 1 TsaE [Clostridiales bacterium]
MLLSVISNSVFETLVIAKTFTKTLCPGDIVLLNGDLGAGKTHFAKGIAEGLEIRDNITSPTFTIMNAYYGGKIPFFHLDMYRIDNEDDVFELGLEEFIFDGGGITAIEWNKYRDFKGRRVFEIDIKRIDDDTREIIISDKTESGKKGSF